MKIIRGNRKGAAMVEFAIVVMLLFTLVFGIIEFGLLIKDYLTLSQAVREGSRSAALGSPMNIVVARVQNSAPTLVGANIDPIELYKRPATTPSGSWEGPLADNDSTTGMQVRVRAEYPHQLLTGFFGSTITISADMVMRRE